MNQRLYYYGKTSDIYSMSYNNGSLKHIKLNEENNGAIAVFREYLYRQKNEKPILEEWDVSMGLVHRNVCLPKPFAVLNDLAIIEKSQHSQGETFIKYLRI